MERLDSRHSVFQDAFRTTLTPEPHTRPASVADAELHPHRFGFFGEDVVEMLGHIFGAPEHVHEIDIIRNIRQLAINAVT